MQVISYDIQSGRNNTIKCLDSIAQLTMRGRKGLADSKVLLLSSSVLLLLSSVPIGVGLIMVLRDGKSLDNSTSTANKEV